MNYDSEKDPGVVLYQRVTFTDCLVKMADWFNSKPKELNEDDVKKGKEAVDLILSKIQKVCGKKNIEGKLDMVLPLPEINLRKKLENKFRVGS